LARGSVYKRGKNYHIVYRVGGRQKWETAGTRKKDAERLLEQRMGAISDGVLHDLKKMIFADFAGLWLEQYASMKVKESTLSSYESIVRVHLRPYFGARGLRSISPADCQQFVTDKLAEGSVSAKTVTNLIVVLKEMLKHAVRWGYLVENPARYLERPRVERKERDYLRPDEIRVFLQGANPDYRALFLTAILTGMRRGELIALRWGDINWDDSTVHVRRSLHKGKFIPPKSKRSVRSIVMSPALKSALRERWITRKENRNDLVFANSVGEPLDPDNLVRREFHPALSRSGLRRIRFHDLRHTYAALLISQGENIKFIQHQLGHASIQTTMDCYGHLLPEVSQGTGKRLDETVFGESVSKMLAKSPSDDSPHKEKAPEPLTVQGLDMVAGAGFEPATFGL